MNLTDKRVLVFGTGISGIAASNLLQEVTWNIILYDSNTSIQADEIRQKLSPSFRGMILIGQLPDEIINTIELVVLSPGVPTDLDVINVMRNKCIPIWGEVELAYHFLKGKIIGITGTNGKTTTTTLVGDIMKAYFHSVFVVGNIGTPFTSVVVDTKDDSVTVAELSSFQLETVHEFRADVSAILNITPDHLNRHHTMDNYIEAKKNITANQGKEQICVLNYEDALLREIGEELQCNVFYFSSLRPLHHGIYLQDNSIIYNNSIENIAICNIKELNIFGRHSYENVMAAVAIALSLSVPLTFIQEAIKNFVAVEHRIEYVVTRKGVKYYNDSKGTNPDASMKAIESMESPTLLIAGGYDKGSDYDEWLQAFGDKIKYLVLLGQTKDKIADTARKYGFHHIIMVNDLKEAVEVCARNANEGDSVLLSPACASMDMFKNYEERGRLFKEYIRELK